MAENSNEKSENIGKAHKEDLNEGQGPESSNPEENLEGEAATSEPEVDTRLAQLEKDHLYLRAEMENMKRQSLKERSQLLKYGAERLARDLLETLDVFRSALASDVTDENYKDFVNGVELTAQSLKNTLEKHGIHEVDCVGKPFDPNTQEALSSEATDEHPEGHVTQVFKPPFQYHDKLLRPGQVIVSRKKTE